MSARIIENAGEMSLWPSICLFTNHYCQPLLALSCFLSLMKKINRGIVMFEVYSISKKLV